MASLNGLWVGENGEGSEIDVEIKDQTIISFSTEVTLSYAGLSCDTSLILFEPAKLVNNVARLRLREDSTIEDPDLYPVNFIFTSSNSAEGTIQAISGYGVGCQIGNELRFEFSTNESILGGPWSIKLKKK